MGVLRFIIGVGFLFFSCLPGFSQNIFRENYNAMPQGADFLLSCTLQGAFKAGGMKRSKVIWGEGEDEGRVYIPAYGAWGDLLWRNENNSSLVVQLDDGRIVVGVYSERFGEYFWHCLDDWKVFTEYEFRRISRSLKEGDLDEKMRSIVDGFSGIDIEEVFTQSLESHPADLIFSPESN